MDVFCQIYYDLQQMPQHDGEWKWSKRTQCVVLSVSGA